MNLVDYEKYYHSGSQFIIPRDKFEKIIEENQRLKEEYIMLQNASEEYEDKLLKENQRLNNVLNKIKIIIDDYYAYDYEDENLERLNVIDKINTVVLNELKESDK